LVLEIEGLKVQKYQNRWTKSVFKLNSCFSPYFKELKSNILQIKRTNFNINQFCKDQNKTRKNQTKGQKQNVIYFLELN
jgi:hypothetical protein